MVILELDIDVHFMAAYCRTANIILGGCHGDRHGRESTQGKIRGLRVLATRSFE
jgi:hypothetical protein